MIQKTSLKTMWKVELMEDEKDSVFYGEWNPIPLQMCESSRHCGCGDREAGMENCDNFFNDTEHYELAKEVFNVEKSRGNEVRIIKIK